MNLQGKIVAWILLLIFCVGISMGYASLADGMFIYGDAYVEGKPYEGVYIYEVSVLSSTGGAEDISHNFIKPTNLMSVVKTSGVCTLTYKVTFHNNSKVTYWYAGQNYEPDVENNSLIGILLP